MDIIHLHLAIDSCVLTLLVGYQTSLSEVC